MGNRCSNQHPTIDDEVVGWVSTFLARSCQNKHCAIPGCLYGHVSQKPGDPPPAGWSTFPDGTPSPASRVSAALRRKWDKVTEGGALYDGFDDHDPDAMRQRCIRFNKANDINLRAGLQLEQAPIEIQRRILAEGPIWGPNPSAGLMSRLNRVQADIKATGGSSATGNRGNVRSLPPTTMDSRSAALIQDTRPLPPPPVPPAPPPGDDYLPPGLADMAARQLMTGSAAPKQIQVSHVQLPGQPPPTTTTTTNGGLAALLRGGQTGSNTVPLPPQTNAVPPPPQTGLQASGVMDADGWIGARPSWA